MTNKIEAENKENLKNHSVAGIVFYDNDLNIYVQKRNDSTRKADEAFSFWGGTVENGETAEEAIKRELPEELGYIPSDLEYIGQWSYVFKDIGKFTGKKIIQNVFIAPVTEAFLRSVVLEGDGQAHMPIDVAIEGKGFVKGSTDFLTSIKPILAEIVRSKVG